MRIIIAAAVPLAFALAGCGESTPADEVRPEPMPAAEVPVELPDIPANSIVTVDYPGTYTQAGPSGELNRLTLNEDNTYEYTGPDGNTITGTYVGLEDGSRIRLEDFNGEPAYFSIGTGAIYRLPGEATPYNEITAQGEFKRQIGAVEAEPATPVDEGL